MIEPFHVKNLLGATLLALALCSPSCVRAEPGWITNFKKAEEEAKASHKLVFVNFTGSDWCGYCIQMDRAILSQPQFKDYASKNLVLLEIDFPNQRGPRWKAQSVELKKQNFELARQFQIEAFPTLVVLNSEGKELWRYDGFYTGGLAAFLAELDKVRKG
jgi:protein disulfide-isomerase